MTLILRFLSHEHAIQVADRRVTAVSTGALVEDHRNKIVMFESHLAFSYSGLAEIGFENTDVWLANRLKQRAKAHEAIDYVREQAAKELSLIPDRSRKRHTFSAVGWTHDGEGWIPFGMTFSNFQAKNGDWLKNAEDSFSLNSVWLSRSETSILCVPVGAYIPADWLDKLRKNLRACAERSVHPLEIIRLLAAVIRRVADQDNRVGKDITAVVLPKAGLNGPLAIGMPTRPSEATAENKPIEHPTFYTRFTGLPFRGHNPDNCYWRDSAHSFHRTRRAGGDSVQS